MWSGWETSVPALSVISDYHFSLSPSKPSWIKYKYGDIPGYEISQPIVPLHECNEYSPSSQSGSFIGKNSSSFANNFSRNNSLFPGNRDDTHWTIRGAIFRPIPISLGFNLYTGYCILHTIDLPHKKFSEEEPFFIDDNAGRNNSINMAVYVNFPLRYGKNERISVLATIYRVYCKFFLNIGELNDFYRERKLNMIGCNFTTIQKYCYYPGHLNGTTGRKGSESLLIPHANVRHGGISGRCMNQKGWLHTGPVQHSLILFDKGPFFTYRKTRRQ